MDTIPILIADKHDISRLGISSIIGQSAGADVVNAVSTADELLEEFSAAPDSVCIISSNITETNVHSLMAELTDINPDAAVIVLSNSADLTHVNLALKSGVRGYFTRKVSAEDLVNAVEAVYSGEQAFSPSISSLIVNKYADLAKTSTPAANEKITKREKEILALIVDGYTSPEIAKLLYISPRTVETHRSNLMQKLNIKNTAGLVRYALEKSTIL